MITESGHEPTFAETRLLCRKVRAGNVGGAWDPGWRADPTRSGAYLPEPLGPGRRTFRQSKTRSQSKLVGSVVSFASGPAPASVSKSTK
jgi:hypothetical protein